MLIYEFKSIPEVLKAILADRRRRNPNYSMRAFARDIEIAPSSLSEIMAGQYHLPSGRAVSIAKALALSEHQTDYIRSLAEVNEAKTEEDKARTKAQLAKFSLDSPHMLIRKEHVELHSSWEAGAILESLKLRKASRTAEWISDAVGLSAERVKELCEILVKHGMISQNEDKTYTSEVDRLTTVIPGQEATPDTTRRKLHASILEKAKLALDDQPLNERDFSAMIYAASKRNSPQVKEALKNFRRAVMTTAEADDHKDSVYCLAIQWFKLAQDPV